MNAYLLTLHVKLHIPYPGNHILQEGKIPQRVSTMNLISDAPTADACAILHVINAIKTLMKKLWRASPGEAVRVLRAHTSEHALLVGADMGARAHTSTPPPHIHTHARVRPRV